MNAITYMKWCRDMGHANAKDITIQVLMSNLELPLTEKEATVQVLLWEKQIKAGISKFLQ